MRSVDKALTKLVSRGYPLALEADKVHEGLARLQTMLEQEIDEAEARQAADEWTPAAEPAPSDDDAAPALDLDDPAPELDLEEVGPALQLESEDDHDD